MSMRAIYAVHKWLAVTVGLFFLVWLVSGIVMILPPIFSAPPLKRSPEALDWRESTMSPAQAVASLETAGPEPPQVTTVTLRRIVDTPVYEVAVAGHGTRMINARSGERFTIEAPDAEGIIRSHFPSASMSTELVTSHSIAYTWGPLPAYRIVLEGDPGTAYYVSADDGEVRRSDRWSRVRAAISSLHTFEPVKLIVRGERVRKGLLFLLSAVGIAAALSGYYLALPRRKRSTTPQVTSAADEKVHSGVEHTR